LTATTVTKKYVGSVPTRFAAVCLVMRTPLLHCTILTLTLTLTFTYDLWLFVVKLAHEILFLLWKTYTPVLIF